MAGAMSVLPHRIFEPRDDAEQARLEAAADRLLRANRRSEPESPYPYYTENWLRRRRRRDAGQAAPEIETLPPTVRRAGLCLRMLGRVPLSRRQRLAVRLLFRGHARAEVAHLLGVDRRTVSDWLRRAAHLLQRAASCEDEPLSPSEMIREVYRQEAQRHGYTTERHCRPGSEECRSTGVCTRRWYLHYSEQ